MMNNRNINASGKPETISTTRRRNEAALKSLIGRKPSLPKSEGPMMRPRRGWKRPGAQGNQGAENDNNE